MGLIVGYLNGFGFADSEVEFNGEAGFPGVMVSLDVVGEVDLAVSAIYGSVTDRASYDLRIPIMDDVHRSSAQFVVVECFE